MTDGGIGADKFPENIEAQPVSGEEWRTTALLNLLSRGHFANRTEGDLESQQSKGEHVKKMIKTSKDADVGGLNENLVQEDHGFNALSTSSNAKEITKWTDRTGLVIARVIALDFVYCELYAYIFHSNKRKNKQKKNICTGSICKYKRYRVVVATYI